MTGSFRQDLIVAVGQAAFGAGIHNPKERIMRFFEEACELARASSRNLGMTDVEAEELMQKVMGYEFSRPVGKSVGQEVAGTICTTYSLAESFGVDADQVVEDEICRMARNIDKCREKHAVKPLDVRAA